MFEGHPKGLWALALANTGERFGYYTMLAVFLFFLQDNFGFSMGTSSAIQAIFLGLRCLLVPELSLLVLWRLHFCSCV